jgi:alpha-glucan,water dikinase
MDTPDVSPTELNEKEESSVLHKLQKWADYESYGGPVNPTKFLPMKTPMSSEIIRNWSLEQPPKHVLTIQSLCRDQLEQKRTIGLIIDLSNHETLYAEDLQSVPTLQYVHIPVRYIPAAYQHVCLVLMLKPCKAGGG